MPAPFSSPAPDPSSRRVVILYNAVGPDAGADEQDVLAQVAAVRDTLTRLGHQPQELPITLDLGTAAERLRALQPDAVFNLVEALGGTDRLMPLATLLLEALRLPFTGSGTEAILATSNKLGAKRVLRHAGLPTPDWWAPEWGTAPLVPPPGTWIVKPVWEHASLGMGDDAVVELTGEEAASRLKERLEERRRATDRPHFAEAFVAGREFNLSLLAAPGGEPTVLPPAEIDFSAFPPDKPRIVGHAAKWDANSFEYRQTPRRFEFPPADATLLRRLTDLARQCWDLFQLRGYARVDFRVDDQGTPWILEVNVNPCLAPDAGYAAALEHAGVTREAAFERILRDAGCQAGLDAADAPGSPAAASKGSCHA